MDYAWTSLARAGALAVLFAAAAPHATSAQSGNRVLSAGAATVRVERVARVEHPWAIAFLPDGGRFLVTERNAGKLRLGARGGSELRTVEGSPDEIGRAHV